MKTLNYAEQNFFCICVGVYKNYEGNDYDNLYRVLSSLKIKKKNKQNLNRKI